MTVSYNLGTDTGKVRLLIGDADIEDAHFTDEDIASFLEMEGDYRGAAALALEAWATYFSVRATDIQLGDYRQSDYHRAREMRALAGQLRAVILRSPAFAISEKAWGGIDSWPGRDIFLNEVLRGYYG